MFSARSIFLLFLATALLLLPSILLRSRSADDVPLRVAAAYLRAIYAHDPREAYKYISYDDKRVRDKTSYMKSQPSYHGFSLQLARRLAKYGEIQLLRQTASGSQTHLELSYAFPALEEVGDIAHNWDAAQLDGLPSARQAHILRTLDSRKQEKNLVMVTGRESYDLVREERGWKLLLNWASSLRVQLDAAPNDSFTVRFSQSELFVKPDDPFQVNLTLKNTSAGSLRVTVVHNVEPKTLADDLTLIECGVSYPVTLDPGTEREFTMAYLLGRSARPMRDVKLTYVLRPESGGG